MRAGVWGYFFDCCSPEGGLTHLPPVRSAFSQAASTFCRLTCALSAAGAAAGGAAGAAAGGAAGRCGGTS